MNKATIVTLAQSEVLEALLVPKAEMEHESLRDEYALRVLNRRIVALANQWGIPLNVDREAL